MCQPQLRDKEDNPPHPCPASHDMCVFLSMCLFRQTYNAIAINVFFFFIIVTKMTRERCSFEEEILILFFLCLNKQTFSFHY